jgi:predicted O-methyltransferase YrrM
MSDLYSELEQQLKLDQGIPYTPDWSAAPDFMQLIVDHALAAKPHTIVECSSGLTTLMLARCCQRNGHGHIYSLENGPEYAEKTRSYFERYGVERYVTVLDAPLEPYNLHGAEYLWYRTDELSGLLAGRKIDMLTIDGPPGFIQKNSRYPALLVLSDLLAQGCTIFLDDAVRDDEQQIIKLWQEQYPDMACSYLATERGCAILKKYP